MSGEAIREYFKAIYGRYQNVKEIKAYNLEEFCSNTGYNRKYAIRKLNGPQRQSQQYAPAPQETYLWTGSLIDLAVVWEAAGSHAQRGKSFNRTMDAMDTEEVPSKSAGRETVAVDQRKADRPQTQSPEGTDRQGIYPRTKAGTLLKHHIPIDRQLGYKDAGLDRSGHCVTFSEQCRGKFPYTINRTDI